MLLKLNELNDPAIQAAIEGLLIGLSYVAQAIGWIIDIAIGLANVIAANWSWIEPIVMGIAIAIGLWAIATLAVTVAKWAATVAQLALNAALMASPITWIILAIAAIIVVFINGPKLLGGYVLFGCTWLTLS